MLSFIGRFILDHLREVDFPVRYGSEEFVVTLPHMNGETALSLAHRLHDSITDAEKRAKLLSPVTIGEVPILGVCRVTPGSSLRLSPAESVSDRLPSFFP